jgi:Xaa-Pro aminopeptidase
MDQIGTHLEVLADVQIKEARVKDFLDREGLDALVIGRQDNFAWLTAGGDSRVVTTAEMGFGYLVLTSDRKRLISYWMDGCRLIEEQVPDQGYELVTLYWHEGSPVDKILELTSGLKVGSDFPLRRARQLGAELTDLHYPLTDLDLKRIRWIGQKSNRILASAARSLEPGVSEQELAAEILRAYALEGMTIDVLIVGFDDRILRYRHPMPTSNILQRYALLHPAVRRWGLHANVTRLVHFGEPPTETYRAMEAVTVIGANVAALLVPGVTFAEILSEQKRLYTELGYPEEWHYHFQGGITGYTLADPARCLDLRARAVERQAFDYFITITGAKFEELMLLTETGVEFASIGEGWPVKPVQTVRSQIVVPDILVR